jgi:YesN/AraC family two-component response regulator
MHKILIIEDEPEILQAVVELIEAKLPSCQTVTANNGLDGFLACQKEKFDLIITDHKMSFMSGAALIVGIRSKEPNNKATPIVMLSGFIDPELKAGLKIQKVRFVEKPFNNDDFLDIIRTYLA